jgi:parallel beta-helix repeat protein
MSKFSSTDSGATILSKLNNQPYTTVGFTTGCDYVCDGTDDQVQIQAAIDYVYSLGGGKIIIKAGDYSISDRINVQSYITIEGEDWNTVITMANSTNDYFFQNYDTTNGNTEIHIKDLKLVGNKAHNTICDGFNMVKVSDSFFEHIRITDARKGWRLDEVTNTTFKDNYLDDPKNNTGAFNFQTGSSYNKVIGNRAEGYTVCVNFDGTDEACNYNVVSENVFSDDQSDDGNTVGDCILFNSGGEGLVVEDGPTFNVISNNTINGFGEDGIRISDNCRNMTVTGNTIQNIGRYAIALSGFDNTDCVISGNAIYGGTTHTACDIGIMIDHAGIRNTIIGNTITDCSVYGILLNHGGSSKNTVTGNTIYNIGSNGIYVQSDENVISANVIDGNGSTDNGIYILNAKNNIVSNNIIKNNTASGIRLQETTGDATVYNIVSGNRIFDDQDTKTQDYGIFEVNGTEDPDYNIYLGNILLGNASANLSLVGGNNVNEHNISS